MNIVSGVKRQLSAKWDEGYGLGLIAASVVLWWQEGVRYPWGVTVVGVVFVAWSWWERTHLDKDATPFGRWRARRRAQKRLGAVPWKVSVKDGVAIVNDALEVREGETWERRP